MAGCTTPTPTASWAWSSEAGGEPVLLGKVPDQPEAVLERLEGAGPLDLLLTSGGVSMGEYDVVRKVLERHGEVVFWKVRQQPGGPLLFARLGGFPFSAFPGTRSPAW